MVKYVKYNKVETENTVLEFKGGSEDLVVTNFTGEEIRDFSVVSISSESEDLIDELINNQPSEISCEVIDSDYFKEIAKKSEQFKRVKQRVAEKYKKDVEEITSKYPLEERETWGIQLKQANLYLESEDENDAPFLKTLADAEGATIKDFAISIIENANNYEQFVALKLSEKRTFENDLLGNLGL